MADTPRFYTTKVPAAKRVASLLELLGKYPGLIDSYHVLNEGGEIAAVAVSIQGVGYRFAPHTEGLRERMRKAGILTHKSKGRPADIAWAQLYTLVEMQLEAVASGVAGVEDVFGGWALTSAGHTVGDMIRERRHELAPGEALLLTSGRSE